MKTVTLKTLKRRAWSYWSIYIRRKGADHAGFNRCFTCGKRVHWKRLHAGHFKHRRLDFDPLNVHPQCVECNTYGHGKLDIYAVKLVETYGLDVVKDLERRAAEVHIYTREELEGLINKYKKYERP